MILCTLLYVPYYITLENKNENQQKMKFMDVTATHSAQTPLQWWSAIYLFGVPPVCVSLSCRHIEQEHNDTKRHNTLLEDIFILEALHLKWWYALLN